MFFSAQLVDVVFKLIYDLFLTFLGDLDGLADLVAAAVRQLLELFDFGFVLTEEVDVRFLREALHVRDLLAQPTIVEV
jgi:hypothetical protein